jgi:hypothetical protein
MLQATAICTNVIGGVMALSTRVSVAHNTSAWINVIIKLRNLLNTNWAMSFF